MSLRHRPGSRWQLTGAIGDADLNVRSWWIVLKKSDRSVRVKISWNRFALTAQNHVIEKQIDPV